MPLAVKILAALGEGLSEWLGPVELKVDKDEISELAEDRERLWRQVSGADFLTRAEKRAQLGFDLEEGQ